MPIESEAFNVPEQALSLLLKQESITPHDVDKLLKEMTDSDRWKFWILTQEKCDSLCKES